MRRIVLILLLLLTACQSAAPATTPAPSSTTAAVPAAAVTKPAAPPAAATAPTTTPAEAASPTATTVTPAATATPEPDTYSVRFHPDDRLYVGDRVSVEVIAPAGASRVEAPAIVEFPTAQGEERAEARFGPHGIAGRNQASLVWAWDTSGLPPGEHPVDIRIGADGPAWTTTVTLLPAEQQPATEAAAQWRVAISECCRVSYISGTLAERQLESVLDQIDAQAEAASERLDIIPDEPIRIVLLPRVLGHGGFASNAISVSYLERDYIGGDKARIIHHEIIHILDGQLGGKLRPSMLVEGLAVYLSDGHFKAEALLPRAAALLPPEDGCAAWSEGQPANGAAEGCGLDRFIPLKTLADDFYRQQHEIGYLEAGALIAYMVDVWGWEAYSAFYRDIQPYKAENPAPDGPTDSSPSAAIDAALRAHFDLSLSELERRFRQALEEQHVPPQTVEDLRLGVQFYDAARRYQQLLDPSAYFATAWLLDAKEMRQRGIVADYVRRPSEIENLALETLLVEASIELMGSNAAGPSGPGGDYAEAARLLAAVETVLAGYPATGLEAFAADALAQDYLELTRMALELGYEPQQIALENGTARMLVSTSEPELVELALLRSPEGWTILTGSGS